jgi:type II secretory pathway component PulC
MNNTITSKINMPKTEIISIALISITIMSVFIYLYSYQRVVARGSEIQVLEDQVLNLKSKISEAEFKIVESKRLINKDIALEKGFVELQEVSFIKKYSQTALNASTN